MDAGATDLARERDQALDRLRVLAAEIRAHEQAMRRRLSARRPADERLYRRLRQINGMHRAASERRVVGAVRSPHQVQS